MDKKKQGGYVTGLICLLLFSFFAYFTIISASNQATAAILGVFSIFFGGLGFGSLWKPESIGAVASQFLKNLAKNAEDEPSDSHETQVQKKSSGVQVMATHGAKVNITVSSEKKRAKRESPEEEEEKKIFRKETIEVSPTDGYSYEFELVKGDHLKGEISSTSRIDIYFVNDFNFDKWNRGKSFDPENCNEGVIETTIDYLVPKRGQWYLIIENNERKSAIVKVLLY